MPPLIGITTSLMAATDTRGESIQLNAAYMRAAWARMNESQVTAMAAVRNE